MSDTMNGADAAQIKIQMLNPVTELIKQVAADAENIVAIAFIAIRKDGQLVTAWQPPQARSDLHMGTAILERRMENEVLAPQQQGGSRIIRATMG